MFAATRTMASFDTAVAGIDRTTVLMGVFVAVFLSPVLGSLSDRFDRKTITTTTSPPGA